MGSFIRLPVVFNAITIVAMLFSLIQVMTGFSGGATGAAEAIQALEKLQEEGVVEDDTLVAGLNADQEMRSRVANYLIATMVIAIVANLVANYLGRGRHSTNLARIRDLEEELRVQREG